MRSLILIAAISICYLAANTTIAQTNEDAATAPSAAEPTTEQAKLDQKTKPDEQPATDASPPTAPKPLGNAIQYNLTEFRRQSLINDELLVITQNTLGIWLEANGEKFLAIWQPDRSGAPKGAALIIPSENTAALANPQLTSIQDQLSEHGWSTLAISLPQQTSRKVPDRPPLIPPSTQSAKTNLDPSAIETTESDSPQAPIDETKVVYDDSSEDLSAGTPANRNAEDKATTAPSLANKTILSSDSADPTIPAEEIAQNRIQSGIAYLIANQQFNNAIVAEGIGAARALKYFKMNSDDKSQSIKALVFINATHEIRTDNSFDFIENLKELTLPVLDIVQDAPGVLVLEAHKKDQKLRASAARVSGIETYVTRSLKISSSTSDNRTAKIVRGFLQQHANGQAMTK